MKQIYYKLNREALLEGPSINIHQQRQESIDALVSAGILEEVQHDEQQWLWMENGRYRRVGKRVEFELGHIEAEEKCKEEKWLESVGCERKKCIQVTGHPSAFSAIMDCKCCGCNPVRHELLHGESETKPSPEFLDGKSITDSIMETAEEVEAHDCLTLPQLNNVSASVIAHIGILVEALKKKGSL